MTRGHHVPVHSPSRARRRDRSGGLLWHRRLRDRWLLRWLLWSVFLRRILLRISVSWISISLLLSLLSRRIYAIWLLSRSSVLSATGLPGSQELSRGSVLSRCAVPRCAVSRRAGARAAWPPLTAATPRHYTDPGGTRSWLLASRTTG